MKLRIEREALINCFGGEDGPRWVQSWSRYGPGVEEPETCWRGAIRHCSPRPGDGYLIEQVEIRRGFGDDWNDAQTRTWYDILGHINGGIEVTDADLADTFGPQWREIVSLVRRAVALTESECFALDAARSAAWGDARADALAAARDAAWVAAWSAARSAARSAAGDAAWVAAWVAAGDVAGDVAGDAAGALVTRDLVGGDYTQSHYDDLRRAWCTVIGPIHPDDAPLGEAK